MSTTDNVNQHPPTIPDPYTSPPITIILTVILLLFFFVGFFCIYFCRCFLNNLLYTMHLRTSPASTPLAPGGAQNGGLDSTTIQSFPTFTYSSVKDYRKEKFGLECAICLIEFQDIDVLRLMTSCCHVFHQECIDLWLVSHKTCPVCRSNLESPIKSDKCPVVINNTMQDINEDELLDDSVRITIHDENVEEKAPCPSGGGESSACGTSIQVVEEKHNAEKFARSHSTGHSIVKKPKEDDKDKFTLKLPEHVKIKIIRGHTSSHSCITFEEFQSKSTSGNGGFAEVSGVSKTSTHVT